MEDAPQKLAAIVSDFFVKRDVLRDDSAAPAVQPCRTVRISGLDDKALKQKGVEAVQKLCANYGTVLKFVALNSFWRRGQAFATFEALEQAVACVKGLRAQTLFGAPLKVEYAREESHLDPARAPCFRPTPLKPLKVRLREAKLAARLQTLLEQLEQEKARAPAEKHSIEAMQLPAQTSRNLVISYKGTEMERLKRLCAAQKGFQKLRPAPQHNVVFADYNTIANAKNASACISEEFKNASIRFLNR